MEDKPTRLSSVKSAAIDQASTIVVFLYIVNGVAVFFILFGWIDPSDLVQRVVGAVSLGFSIVGLLAYIQMGVKHQNNSKKKGRK